MSALPRAGVAALLFLFAVDLAAQGQVQRVVDLNTGPNIAAQGSMFNESAVRFAGLTLFTARTDRTGRELWRTDGTPQGTRLLLDLCPGRCDGFSFNARLQLVDGLLFFSASDGVHGFEPWVWQAGQAAPRMLVDLNPGAPSSSPGLITSLSFFLGGLPVERHFLSAERADVGRELWRLTVDDNPRIALERDLATGPLSSSPSSVEVVRNGTLIQSAVIGVLATLPGRGQELYGLNYPNAFAPPSSQFLFDLFQNSPRRSLRSPLAKIGSNVFVVVQDNDRGFNDPDRQELWVTLGSVGNTQLLRTGASIDQLTAHPELQRLFYAIRLNVSGNNTTRLGISDGTVAGTTVSANSGAPSNLFALPQRLVYTFASSITGAVELRASLGASASTEQIREIRPADITGILRLFAAANLQRTRVFVGFDDRLWSSDGTAGGTQLLAGLNPGVGTGRFDTLAPLAGTELVFGWAPDQLRSQGEPYFSSSTTGTTVALGNLAGDVGDSEVRPLGTVGSRVVFTAYRGTGTNQLTYALDPGSGSVQALPINNSLPLGNHYGRLWLSDSFASLAQTDGTPAGTFTLPELNIEATAAECIVERGGLRYFIATPRGTSDREVWRSDGSAAGSFAVTDFFNPGAPDSPGVRDCRGEGRTNLARLGDSLLVEASSPATGAELYLLDANDQTRLVADLRAGPLSSAIGSLVALPSRVIFSADDGVFGQEVWASDGTAQGTQRLSDIDPGAGDALETDPYGPFIRAGTRAYFAAFDPVRGRELHVTDGTAAGTRRVADLVLLGGSAFSGNLFGSTGGGIGGGLGPRVAVAIGEELVFAAAASSPCVLFRTHDSGSNARCAYDPAAVRFGPIREIVATSAGVVVFSAARLDLAQGEEIHALFGDQLLNLSGADIAPGPQSSAPRFLRVDGETVFFQADDGSTGRELWRLDLGDLAAIFRNGFETP